MNSKDAELMMQENMAKLFTILTSITDEERIQAYDLFLQQQEYES